MPTRVYELTPLATLIGTIYALAQLAANSEYTVMRASGFSTRNALMVIARIGAGIVLVMVLFGEVVAPGAERLSIKVKASALGQGIDSHFRSGQWLRDTFTTADGDVKVRFVNFQDMTPGGALRKLQVYEFDSAGRLREMLLAATAQYSRQGHWQLTDVLKHNYPSDIGPSQPVAQLNQLQTLAWESSLTPELLSGLYIELERMSGIQLWRYKDFLEKNNQRTDQLELALAKKLIYPFAVLVMMMIALPFAYLQVRAGGLSVRIFIGIMLGIGFHLLNNLFSHLSVIAKLHPLVSAGLPTFIGFMGSVVGLWWVQRVR
jgi:lipopolysaccharide export system permease protein